MAREWWMITGQRIHNSHEPGLALLGQTLSLGWSKTTGRRIPHTQNFLHVSDTGRPKVTFIFSQKKLGFFDRVAERGKEQIAWMGTKNDDDHHPDYDYRNHQQFAR